MALLPPNMTDILQVLDLVVYGPYQGTYTKLTIGSYFDSFPRV
jgi:hypothetical protein